MNVAAPTLSAKPELTARTNDLERRRELGQFFTPVSVAGFMWDFLEIIHGGLFPARTRLIDPACGDGVFLRVGHERGNVAADHLFGTDIDETLAPTWRKDLVMDHANVHVANGLIDNRATGIKEGTFDIVVGNPPFSGKGLSELLRLLEEDPEAECHKEVDLFETSSLKEEPAEKSRPLSNQQRAELDCSVRVLSQYACWRLSPNLEEDALTEGLPGNAPLDFFAGLILSDSSRVRPTDYERAAHLIKDWPPNRLLDKSRPEIRDVIRRLATTAIEVFFTERFTRLAKPGGLIAIIVPESIVASDRLGALRRWLSGQIELFASVSLPQKVFTGVGANAKTTILFAQRCEGEQDANRLILLSSPQLEAPNWTLDGYLDSILELAGKKRNELWPNPR